MAALPRAKIALQEVPTVNSCCSGIGKTNIQVYQGDDYASLRHTLFEALSR
jgi:hypothetical protein